MKPLIPLVGDGGYIPGPGGYIPFVRGNGITTSGEDDEAPEQDAPATDAADTIPAGENGEAVTD